MEHFEIDLTIKNTSSCITIGRSGKQIGDVRENGDYFQMSHVL